MATVDDVARSALDALDTDAGLGRAIKYASNRYRELTTRSRFRHLRQIGSVQIPASIDDGTVTISRDSTIVTGNATAQAAWTDDLVGWFIRIRSVWYEVGSVVRDTSVSLRLTTPYSEDASSGASYILAPRFISLDANARQLGSFLLPRFYRELQTYTQRDADIMFPSRIMTNAAGPWIAIDAGVDVEGIRRMEFYPYPAQSELVSYVYWTHSPELKSGDSLPRVIDPYVLKEGILIDLYRYEMAKATREGRIEAAALWRNESRAQKQTWEEAIRDANKADKGVDDVTFILRSDSFSFDPNQTPFFNDSARSEIYIRGNRP